MKKITSNNVQDIEKHLEKYKLNDIPGVVSNKIKGINDSYNEYVQAAGEHADSLMRFVNGNNGSSDVMKSYKIKGRIFKHRSGNTKDIIESSQDAIRQLAEAQQVTVKAVEKLFEFQQQLANASTFLFYLGCSNIAANRSVMRELSSKLNEEELSDLAQKELESVIHQLKEQASILERQERLEATVMQHDVALEENTTEIGSLKKNLKKKDTIDEKQTKQINTLNTQFSEKKRIDEEQSKRLDELNSLINTKNKVDQKQEEAIKKNAKSIKILFDYTKQKDVLDKKQSEEIEVIKKLQSTRLCFVAIIISGVSLVVSITTIILELLK